MLADEGKLAWTTRSRNSCPTTRPRATRITVEHLLTHTSGIKSYTAMPECGCR